MNMNGSVTKKEKVYLRELAEKQLEYASLPEMKEKEALWYAHNALQGKRPMVVMEEETFLGELMPLLRCTSEAGKWMERKLLQTILAFEVTGDDKVVPDYFTVFADIEVLPYNLKLKRKYASDGIGYHIEPAFDNVEEGLGLLEKSVFTFSASSTRDKVDLAKDILDGILPVKIKNNINYWEFGLTQKVVNLMGMENMFCSMISEPEEFHKLMDFVLQDLIRFLRWQEENGLLFLNNKNDYMGSGSYCFNQELTGKSDRVISRDTWGHLNSQESVGLSPEMFGEFILPYYREMAKEFGLVYYGCCEPVDVFWDDGISRIPNLRKVSISPWCNESIMGERLQNSSIIYSRKPSPNYLGVEREFDKESFQKYIRETVKAARGCKVEFIFRDIYRLHGNTAKVREAVKIVRELTADIY